MIFAPELQQVAKAQKVEIIRDTVRHEVITYRDSIVDGEQDIQFYFRLDSSTLDKSFSTNAAQIAALDSIMQAEDVMIGLDSILINAAASIDGPKDRNATLAMNRSQSVKDFLSERYPQMNPDLIQTRFIAEDWAMLREAVVADPNIPHKDDVLRIIDDKRREDDNREWVLKTLHSGGPWEYMKLNILPELRYGASLMFYYQVEKQRIVTQKDIITVDTVIIPTVTPQQPLAPQPEAEKWAIALKTNLLYDAVLTPNVELEIPIGRRWSVGVEYIFPWWSNNKSNYTQRIRMGHLSATYWLGDRDKHELLTGWNVGLFGGYGDYDIQLLSPNGEQGTVFNSGVSFGYSHSIAKNLNLHYQVGLGYAQFSYRTYQKMWDTKYGDIKVFDYPWETKRRDWFGPTQLEVSLVWVLNF